MSNSVVLLAAVVDSSVIMSIFDRRPSGPAFVSGLQRSLKLYMSAPTLMELSVVFLGKKIASSTTLLDDLLARFNIEVLPFDQTLVQIGRRACVSFGRGHHPAALNYGDLFSYSLAISKSLPLYFEGLDFSKTDVLDAMQMLGYAFDSKHAPVA